MGKRLDRSEETILNSFNVRIEQDGPNKVYIGCFGTECIEFCKGVIDPELYTTRAFLVDYNGYKSKVYAISDDIDEFQVLAKGFLKKLILGGYV